MFRNPLIYSSCVFLLLNGCGGGGDGSSDTSSYGVFHDSRVAGLEYQSTSYSGITDGNGTFRFQSGETIRFSIGDIVIGETEARGIITPMNLVGVTDPNNDTVVNIARFLQTLDDDANPQSTDGIVITEAVRMAAVGLSMNFNQTIAAYESDTTVLTTISTLTQATSAGSRTLMPSADAVTHLSQTLDDLLVSAADTYSGNFGVEQNNCTDGQDHSYTVAQGNLHLTSPVTGSSGVDFSGDAAFTEFNFDVVNRYEFTLDSVGVDLLGNITGSVSHAVYSNDQLVNSVSGLPVTGTWDGNKLVILFAKTPNVGVNEAGSIRCDSGAVIEVNR